MNVAAYTLNVLSLCSGAGGLELGLHAAEPRARTVCYVEREAYAAACLVARMEDQALDQAPVWDDVATFDAAAWRGLVDIVTSGDPCQPNSVAGNRKGTGDDRWLLDHVLEIFDQSGAHTFFRENVPGNADGQLSVLVPALEGMGCTVAAGIFSAAEVGASHRRERLFVLAHRDQRRFNERANAAESAPSGRRRTRKLESSGEHVGESAGARHGTGRPGQGGPLRDEARRAEPDGRCDAVGNTEGGAGRAEPEGEGRNRAGFAGTGEAVAHPPSGRGRQVERGQAEEGQLAANQSDLDNATSGRDERPGVNTGKLQQSFGGDCDFPLFAPGPADPRWPAILESAPHLEPAVRRVADGLAYRVDRLRLTGNGVFPLAAAYAYRTLSALLADARAGKPVLMEAAE